MAFTFQEEVSNGVQTVYPVDFDFQSTDTVYVYTGEHSDYGTQINYRWITGNQEIELLNISEVPSGTKFYIRRIVPRDDLVHKFVDRSIRGRLVDEENYHLLYLVQEFMDGFMSLGDLQGVFNDLDMQGNLIKNLGDAVDDTDAVNLRTVNTLIAVVKGANFVQEEAPVAGLAQGVRWYKPSANEEYIYYIDTKGDGLWTETTDVGDNSSAETVETTDGSTIQTQLDIKEGVTVAEAKVMLHVPKLLGDTVRLTDRKERFQVVLTATVTPNDMDVIQSTRYPDYSFKLVENVFGISLAHLGAIVGSPNAAEVYERATELAAAGNKTVVVSEDYDFGSTTATQTNSCEVVGGGSLKNVVIEVDLPTGDTNQLKMSNIKLLSDTGFGGINPKKTRFAKLDGVSFIGLTDAIFSDAVESTPFHSIGLMNVTNCVFISCGNNLKFTAAHPENRPFNDLKWTNNTNWFCKQNGIYAEQLDGLTYSDNLSHFNDNTTTAQRHVHIAHGEQIVIGSGNTNFNCGLEAYYFEEIASLQIGGSQRFYHTGQEQASSGIKIENTPAKFLWATIDGALHFEKPSLHMLEIQANNGIVNVGDMTGVVDVRIGYDEIDNPDGHFYGTEDLTSIQHYGIHSPQNCRVITCQKNLKFQNVSGSLLNIANNIQLVEDSQEYRTKRNVSGTAQGSVNVVDNSTTTIFRVFDSEQNNGIALGEVTVCMYSTVDDSRAIYKLLVSSGENQDLQLVSSAGDTSGANANDPAFTFGIFASGDVYVNRVGATAGLFDYVVHGQNDLYPRVLS